MWFRAAKTVVKVGWSWKKWVSVVAMVADAAVSLGRNIYGWYTDYKEEKRREAAFAAACA